MFGGDKVKSIANLAKGQDRGNSVTIQVNSFSLFSSSLLYST